MKLKRLMTHGFKSFKDRTVIHFNEGITGIVGPNGCGKSNVVDALFWVMGEMSAKHLRGSSMKDVIFAGSAKYNPASFAEVTLVLDNEELKHIRIGKTVANPSEIAINRKLYRNGETEYRINNQICRLRDIQEIFMDTGAGAKSYSIIAQGEIDKLVKAKPEERRAMIEEVAGITKFKARKKESLKKIEQTENNLNRLQDLQIEIEKNLKSLKGQAEKAEKAKDLREKIKRNELTVSAHKVFDALKNWRDGQNKYLEFKLDIEEWSTKKTSLENDLVDERLSKIEKEEEIESFQKEYNEKAKELAKNEERLEYLAKSLTEKETLLESRKKESEEFQEELKDRSNKLEELNLDLEKFDSLEDKQSELSDLEEKTETIKEDLDLKRDQVNDLKDELEEAQRSKIQSEQEMSNLTQKIEEFGNQIEDLTKEIELIEEDTSGLTKNISLEREAVSSLEEEIQRLQEAEVKTKEDLQDLEETQKVTRKNLEEVSEKYLKLKSSLHSLESLNNSFEGVKTGTKILLESDSENSFKLLGQTIQCDEKYSSGAQVLLEEVSEAIISTSSDRPLSFDQIKEIYDQNSDKNGIEYFGFKKNIEASESGEIKERFQHLGLENIISLAEVIQSEEIPHQIFEGQFLVETIDQEKIEKIINSDLNFKSLSTYDGKILVKNFGNGVCVSLRADKERENGIVERNVKIQEIKKQIDSIEKEKEEVQAQLVEIEEKMNSQKVEIDRVRETLLDQKTHHASKKAGLQSRIENLKQGSSRLEILKERKVDISKKKVESLEKEESLGQDLESMVTKLEDIEDVYGREKEDLELLESQYSDEKEEYLKLKMEVESFDEKKDSLERQIRDIEGQIQKQEQRVETTQGLVCQYEKDIVNLGEELENIEVLNKNMSDELLKDEEFLNEKKDDHVALLSQMQEREEEVKKLGKNINKTEKEMVAIEVKREQALEEEAHVVKDIFEKFRVDLRSTIAEFLEFTPEELEELNNIDDVFVEKTEMGDQIIPKESYAFQRRYGQDLKDLTKKLKSQKAQFTSLGEINWQAIEDYNRQKVRFDFLSEQEEELKAGLLDLNNAILQIDEKSKERFKLAFDEVNEKFTRVFPIIFGGGSAQLKVSGDINDPECGVQIIAQPPGKKMQNINLMSGGEKALTAVALIFSIFLVKPSPFCLLDEVDAPLDDANVGRFNELLREMGEETQFILITHNKKTMELNDTLYGITMQEPGISKAVSVQLQ